MSNVIARAHQVGISATAAQNFTLQTPAAPDGTMKLARGLKDATTQDVFTVGADGQVTFNQGLAQFQASAVNGAVGWQKLPSGMMVQWATTVGTTDASGNFGISYPLAFPTATVTVIANSGDSAQGNLLVAAYTVGWPTKSGHAVNVKVGHTGANYPNSAVRINWIALGY